jgi:UDP-N-acetyl-D-mannosaminuronic acid dehydrogenase
MERIPVEFKKICMLGLGYIGLPTASMFANAGLEVVGVDVNEEVVRTLQRGELHIHEPGLRDAVRRAIETGRLTFSNQTVEADAFIIAVPTPFYDDKRADMRAVTSATEMILPVLRKGNLVVLESTSPPRTTIDLVKPILERSGLKAGVDFSLCYSPERVLPGQILRELVENARVMGGVVPASAEAGRDLYTAFVKGEIFLTTATTAEMVKLMENTYRDVNIAIANEFSRLADRFGVDVWEAISLANKHPRVKILNPGPGVGGHCISVDPWFFVEAAPDLTPLIRTARNVNDGQPHFVLHMVEKALGGDLKNKRIAVLGLAFKPDVDDLRESPAIEIVHLLRDAGADVIAFEPFKADFVIPGVQCVGSLAEAVANAELILVLVGHTQFKQVRAQALSQLTPARLVMDMVNAWQPADWGELGFRFIRLGVGR